MKHISYFAFAVLVFALTVFSCTQQAPPPQPQQPAPAPIKFEARQSLFELVAKSTDTLTNADTVTTTIGSYFGPVNYNVQVFADSLSGATAGTATLQHSVEMSGSDWVDLSGAVTIDGVSTASSITGAVIGGRLRLRTISSGTQSTALRSVAVVTEDNP